MSKTASQLLAEEHLAALETLKASLQTLQTSVNAAKVDEAGLKTKPGELFERVLYTIPTWLIEAEALINQLTPAPAPAPITDPI